MAIMIPATLAFCIYMAFVADKKMEKADETSEETGKDNVRNEISDEKDNVRNEIPDETDNYKTKLFPQSSYILGQFVLIQLVSLF
jgi:hypothetical protein